MIIPKPTRSRKFKMLPIPKSLNKANVVNITETIKPLLEFPKTSDAVKKSAANKIVKNKTTKRP